MKTPRREDCVYTSCYCEENVWHLCSWFRSEAEVLLKELKVLFISNDQRTVPLWKQKSGRADFPVIWPLVFDLDSVLDFPCSLQEYFGPSSEIGPGPAASVPQVCLVLQVCVTETKSNLQTFIQMKEDLDLGRVFSLTDFMIQFNLDLNRSEPV
ncbi:hypothetical protein WMY93_019099 [Mugilogobius chulae]|uniref:Protein N-terminal glutamine amidohydrolase n=1 Tax=Mugilogobius chulae TaxID=88201 RepID=A0AAW0NDC1_9GOBI